MSLARLFDIFCDVVLNLWFVFVSVFADDLYNLCPVSG